MLNVHHWFVAHDAEATLFKADGSKSISVSMPMTQDPQCVRAFRDELALRTVQEAQRLFPEAIKFHYKTAVTKVDFKRQLVHLSRDGSNTTEVCAKITSTRDAKVYIFTFDLAESSGSVQAAILEVSIAVNTAKPQNQSLASLLSDL